MRGCRNTGALLTHYVLEDLDCEAYIDVLPPARELSKGCYLPQYREGPWNRIMSAVFPQYATELKAELYIVNWRECYA